MKTPSVNERLAHASLRPTRARIAVAELLKRVGRPASHADLVDSLADRFDRVTLYRAVTQMVEVGLVERVDLGDRTWRFEWKAEHEPAHAAGSHPHFICTACHAVECLPGVTVAIKTSAKAPASVLGNAFAVRLSGLCDACK